MSACDQADFLLYQAYLDALFVWIGVVTGNASTVVWGGLLLVWPPA